MPTSELSVVRRAWSYREIVIVCVPVLALVSQLVAWWTYGIDLPNADDWRDLRAETAGSFDIGYLFDPWNDTISPVGKILDGLALRYLGGNAIAYQSLSMIGVLGSLAVMQFMLLRRATSQATAAISAFGLTVLMLRSGTYWGGATLAYHQAIPLVATFAIFIVLTSDRWSRFLSPLAIFVAAMLSGYSRISGAIADLVLFAICATLAFALSGAIRKRLVAATLALAVPALTSTALQLRVLIVVQEGTHRDDAPMAFPWEMDFWAYTLGKIGHSLYLPASYPTFSLIVTVIVVAVSAVLTYQAAKELIGNRSQLTMETFRLPFLLVAIAAVVASYLMQISAGRANLRGDSVTDFLDVFAFGFRRFHYFWVTLLWPWIWLTIFDRASSTRPSKPDVAESEIARDWRWLSPAAVGPSLMIPLLALFCWAGLFGHSADYREVATRGRVAQLACIYDQRIGSETRLCERFGERQPSVSAEALLYAEEAGHTFLRTMPAALAGLQGEASEFVLLRSYDAQQISNAMVLENGLGTVVDIAGRTSFRIEPQPDTKLIFSTQTQVELSKCSMLSVDVSYSPPDPLDTSDRSQLFFVPADQPSNFSAQHSISARRLTETTPTELRFLARDRNGFQDQLRLDLTTGTEAFEIHRIEVRCSFR